MEPQDTYGELFLGECLEDGTLVWHAHARNQILAGLGFAVAKALGMRDPAYVINYMYIEFENTTSAISNPVPDRKSGRSYYTSLSAPKDYLRVPLIGLPELSVETGDGGGYAGLYGSGEGNVCDFLGMTNGSSGVNGVTFASGSNSKVYGVGLVCAPAPDDATQDIVVCRGYFDPSTHRSKQASGQIAVRWKPHFLPPANA